MGCTTFSKILGVADVFYMTGIGALELNSTDYAIRGDLALNDAEQDKLNFSHVAQQLATSLVDPASSAGLVVGLEGAWGSGKSSLLFLVSEQLQGLPPERRPSLIAFEPWLIGNREALVSSLFSELLKELDRVAVNSPTSAVLAKKASKAARALRGFMSGLSKAGATIEVAGSASGFDTIKLFGSFLKASASMWSGKSVAPQLADLKENLVSALRQLDRRFVVTIDDVDRLEPAEAVEVLRLVRSVVDLPNVIYLLCYDRDILAHSVEQASGVKSGQAYLEKIVQLAVMVPKPEPFELREWFTSELGEIASPNDDEERGRLLTVVDIEGGRYLKTPRSVVRTLDAVRFSWPPLREMSGDLPDLVWLQLIKDGNPALYRWIEEYCAGAALISLGTASVDEKEKHRQLKDLLSAVPSGYFDNDSYCHHFAEQLPGIEPAYGEDGKIFEIYSRDADHLRNASIREKRLSSPDHYRLYFAMSGPSHALLPADFTLFRQAASESAEDVGRFLLALQNKSAGGTLTKADMMFERLKDESLQALDEDQCARTLIALSLVLDQAHRERLPEGGWLNTIWDRSERLAKSLLKRLESEKRKNTIEHMFECGRAVGWLTHIVRRARISQGRAGKGNRPESEWLFSRDELDAVIVLMVDRYRKMSAATAFAVPNPITLLFNWLEIDDGEGPRKLIEEHIASDQGLLTTLETLMSKITTDDRRSFKVLKNDVLSTFMDASKARERVERLQTDPILGERAALLANAFRMGEHW